MRHKSLKQPTKSQASVNSGDSSLGPADSRVILRYTLLQVPALAAMAGVGWLLVAWDIASWPLVAGGLMLWILKDALLYPFVWRSYTGGSSTNSSLHGKIGYVVRHEQGIAWARFGRAIWRVQHRDAHSMLIGHKVRVVGDRDLVLEVESVDESP